MKNIMKKIMRRSTAVLLAAVVMSVTPLSDLRPTAVESSEKNAVKAAETNDGKYISDIKLAMGETAKIAVGEVNELEKHGYEVLMKNWDPSTKDGKVCANLNEGAGTKSYLKEGPNDKYVYLCYKTTDNPDEAITDMAVMNMNGGYSIADYSALVEDYLESKIYPFVEDFVFALKEYRENHKDKNKGPGYIRSEYIRLMLNKLIDDDTGEKMGDLLLNETKYEIGDDRYNRLSDAEKKKHADIVTILTQANGQATLSIESLITKATDASGSTWIERLDNTTEEDLFEAYEKDNEDKHLTQEDIYKELDKKYRDSAEKLLGEKNEDGTYANWEFFREKVLRYDEISSEIEDKIEETTQRTEETVKDSENLQITVNVESEKNINAVSNNLQEVNNEENETTEEVLDLQTMTVCDYLNSVEYGESGKTLLDFFSQKSSEVSGKTNIRKLYPIVDALTVGQLAGLDFLSYLDLFTMAMADENVESDVEDVSGEDLYKQAYELMKDVEPASVYEKVDRGIYKKGAVALTSKALRVQASEAEKTADDAYEMGKLPQILWSVTAGIALATVGTVGVYTAFAIGIKVNVGKFAKTKIEAEKLVSRWCNPSKKLVYIAPKDAFEPETIVVAGDTSEAQEAAKAAADAKIAAGFEKGEYNTAVNTLNPTPLFKALTIGIAVITVIAITASAVVTIIDKKNYYNTKFLPIPKYMVEEETVTDKDGKLKKNQSAYYRVVETTRANGPSDIEKENYKAMGTFGDLNGDVGKQWLALYTVKYETGKPILTKSLLYQFEKESVPTGYSTGIHEFGSTAACNLNNPKYLYEKSLLSKAKPPVIKLFYKTEAKTVTELLEAKLKGGKAGNTGSLFTKGYGIAIGGGILFVFLVGFAAVYGRRRRKAIEK